jgi:integrase
MNTTNNTISNFLDNFSSEATKQCYKSALKKYFKTIERDPDAYFTKGKGQYTAADLDEYEKDVKKFWQSIMNAPPNTIKGGIASVKVFLSENYVDLPNKVWKDLRKRTKGTRSVIDDFIPTRDDLKKILSHGNAMERAAILTLASSGMRIGELCQIKIEDIDFNNKPVKIDIKREYTKTGNRRVTFVSDECADALNEWLKERQVWLKQACDKINFKHYTKSSNDDRVFPLVTDVLRIKWNRLLKNTGKPFSDMDKSVKIRHALHPHCLRKFFRSNLPGNGMDADIVECLMGHEEYLTRVYAKYTPKDLGDKYLAAMSKVTIFSTPTDLTSVNEEIKELKEENKELHKDMEKLMRKLAILTE